MKSEFKRVVDAQLSGVEWTNIHTENVLKRLEDEKMTKRISVKTLLIAAVLFVLTAAVAFAVVAITRSPEAEAMNTARTSVMEKYGLNAEAIAFMDGRYEKTDDGWKVVFGGDEKTGEYEVVFDGKTATATWSYEGTEKASTAWKNDEIIAQLKKIGEFEKRRMTEYPETGEYLKPTIGDAADNVHMQDILYAEPREGDLSEEKALEIYYDLCEHQEQHRRAELESGLCLTGCHKDDIEIFINGQSARSFASQGQTRTAALSMKLAEREIHLQEFDEYPVLLLDDVLSELDPGRQEFVLNRIGGGQTLITCCEGEQISRRTGGKVITVRGGEIR